MQRKAAIVLALSTLAAVACWEETPHDTVVVERTFDSAGITEIDLESVNGRIEVVADPSPMITLHARLEIPEGADPAAFLRSDLIDGRLKVREDWGKRSWMHNSGGGTYTLTVPPTMRLELSSTNGRITTEGVEARQHVTTVNGRIEIETSGADINARTVNGRIVAVYSDRFPGGEFQTVNGSIRVEVPEATRLSADVQQVNGSFNSELPVTLSSSDQEAVVLSASSVNGSITVARSTKRFGDDSSVSHEPAPVDNLSNEKATGSELVIAEENLETSIATEDRF